MTKTGA